MDFAKILELYEVLCRIKSTPIVALNRAVALGNALGPEKGLSELSKIPDPAKLKDYPFYPTAQGGISPSCRPPGGGAEAL
jgi:RNA polymerase sigma-70 factor (ECF subfamily)